MWFGSDLPFKTLGSGSDLSQAPGFGPDLSNHINEPMIRRIKKIVTYGNGSFFDGHFEDLFLVIPSVADPDPNPDPDSSDSYVLALLDPDPDSLVRGMDPDPSIIKQ